MLIGQTKDFVGTSRAVMVKPYAAMCVMNVIYAKRRATTTNAMSGRYKMKREGERLMNRGRFIPNILKHYGTVYETESGWICEVNLVSWNGNPPKIDIREWQDGHKRNRKTATFTPHSAKKLCDILQLIVSEEY